ncbi:MAG: hypothetical protein V4697_03650 [Patescibacteria group bacterium]
MQNAEKVRELLLSANAINAEAERPSQSALLLDFLAGEYDHDYKIHKVVEGLFHGPRNEGEKHLPNSPWGCYYALKATALACGVKAEKIPLYVTSSFRTLQGCGDFSREKVRLQDAGPAIMLALFEIPESLSCGIYSMYLQNLTDLLLEIVNRDWLRGIKCPAKFSSEISSALAVMVRKEGFRRWDMLEKTVCACQGEEPILVKNPSELEGIIIDIFSHRIFERLGRSRRINMLVKALGPLESKL